MNRGRTRQAIRTGVRRAAPRLKTAAPLAVLGILGAAAVAPIVPSLLAAGLVGVASDKARELLRGTAEDLLAGFIAEFVAKRGDGATAGLTAASEEALQADLERELIRRLEAGGDEAAGLRAELAALLQSVGGVEVALDAVSDDVRAALAKGLGELGVAFDEFRWVLRDVHEMVFEIQGHQAVQLNLQRETLAKINLLLLRRERALRPGADTHETHDGDPGPADEESPYKGLESIQSEDADRFFGC